jgi:hypothetical protein
MGIVNLTPHKINVSNWVLVAVLVAVLLTGCRNSMKEARAAGVRAETRRRNEIHAMKMAERRATANVRLATMDAFYYSLAVSGSVVIVGGGCALTWLMIGGSINHVKHRRVMRVPLDPVTRQYPLLVYGNGRRVFNPNNGERLLLSEISEAGLPRIEATAKVQLAGLISDGSNSSKVIEG